MRLAIGTVQFGVNYGISNLNGKTSRSESEKILKYAKNRGITTLDTAINYGESEKVLGEIGVGSWDIVTKLPAIPGNCETVHDWVIENIRGSLRRLNVDKVYGLLLHRPNQLLSKFGKDLIDSLACLKDKGLIKKVGISVYSPEELREILQFEQLDIVQAPVNIFDRRLVDSGLLSYMNDRGIEFHARSVFLQGLLLMKPEDRPEKFNQWNSLLGKWDLWLKETGLSPVKACLDYVLSIPQIEKVIVGVENVRQLEDICDYVSQESETSFPSYLKSSDNQLLNPSFWQ